MFAKLRPSPAMVVAILALVVALGGTAFAGPVARMANTISGGTIQPRTIPGNRLELNTVTGKEIMESSLGPVPTATNAGHAGTANSATNATNAVTAANAKAVGGITVRKIFYAPPGEATANTTILSLGGLTLSASCPNGIIAIRVISAVDHSHLSSEMWNSAQGGGAAGLHRTDYNTTNSFQDLSDGNAWGETSFTWTRPGGTIVNGQLAFDSSAVNSGDKLFNDTAKCLVSGFAMSTASS